MFPTKKTAQSCNEMTNCGLFILGMREYWIGKELSTYKTHKMYSARDDYKHGVLIRCSNIEQGVAI